MAAKEHREKKKCPREILEARSTRKEGRPSDFSV